VITDFETTVFISPFAIDALPATKIGPMVVLMVLLSKAARVETDVGERFLALVNEIEISVMSGLRVGEMQNALARLVLWGWVRRQRKGYEVGYQSAGGEDIFYANEAYVRLGQLLNGVEPTENRIEIAKRWVKNIEGTSHARGF